MTYDSLSHPMLRQSSPKNITCHFNSSQKTIAERYYALTQYFKNTRLDLRTSNILISSTLTVDQFISKTIILLRISHYCTKKYYLSFQLTYHMISVHVVVVVSFTLTDRATTTPSNTRGCQSGTWSAGQKKIRGTSTKLQ